MRWCSGVADPGARSGQGDHRVCRERIVEQIARSVLMDRIKDRIAEQSVDVFVPKMRRQIVEVIQLVLVERIKDKIADHMVDHPCASGHGGRGSFAGGGEVGPTGTRSTDRLAHCGGAQCTNSGGH